MRVLFFVVCLLITGCATNGNTGFVRVTGTGINENAALQAAFAVAVEQETGTLILSERESQNLRLFKNDILSYSSGYVDNFKIISTINNHNSVTVVVDVVVSESKIKSRILGHSKSNKDFDGQKHGAQYNSYLNQRDKSDKLMDQVFENFPDRAFNVSHNSYQIELDSNRNAIVKIPFKFSWNHNFLIAVDEMLRNIEDVPNFYSDHKGFVIVIIRKPGEFIGTQNRYRFNDMSSIKRLNILIENNQPMIRVKMVSRFRTILHESCISPRMFLNSRQDEKFYNIRRNDTTLIGNTDAKGVIHVTIPPRLNSMLNNITAVEMDVVSENKCR